MIWISRYTTTIIVLLSLIAALHTARVIWAYHSLDPVSLRTLGNLRHEQMGSISLNLIGGSSEENTESNSDFFIVNNENVNYIIYSYAIKVCNFPASIFLSH